VQSRSLRRAQDVRKQLLTVMDRYWSNTFVHSCTSALELSVLVTRGLQCSS
jgi:hypothetical protein